MDKEKNIKIIGDDNKVIIEDAKSVEIKGDKNNVEIEEELIKINKKDMKASFERGLGFFKQKKVLAILTIIALIAIIFIGTSIRVQNLDLLKDSTTGKYIPLALDPFYFLRIAETAVDAGGFHNLPEFDPMRAGGIFDVKWHPEILPKSIVLLWKIGNIFGDYGLGFIDVINPVVFFILGLIVFFFLTYILTKSKLTALLSAGFLAVIPSYLYRTMAGFSDHEAIGMFAFFLALLSFSISLIYLNKEKILSKTKKVIPFAILLGFVTSLTLASWGGIVTFLFMIIPFGFFIFYLTKSKDSPKNELSNLIWFYIIWIVSLLLFGILFGFEFSSIIGKFMKTSALFSLFVPLFMIVDYFLMNNKHKFRKIKQKYRQAYSFIIAGIMGIILLSLMGKNIFHMLSGIWNYLLHPFGQGRVGLTVAENAQPYLKDWIAQTGKTFFWMFLTGLTFLGIEISKGVEGKKEKSLFIIYWILMFLGILFSRISSNSLLNGDNFISQVFYILSLLIFIYYSAKLYFNNKIKIKPELIIISIWMFFMIVSVRSAIRFFFALTPFVCFMASSFIVKSYEYLKKNKDEMLKIILIIVLVLGIIGLAYNFNGFYKSSKVSGKNTGPSANIQWQKAMEWTRNNTPPDSIFLHWWDYGYWVQYLGERPTIADGGHFEGAFRDHLIGRYVLTEQKSEKAMSFMKSNNISYLLIDQTDLGKYSAYSKIGSDENWDRFAYLTPFVSDKKQIQETASGTTRIYQGGIGVDEDIIYENNGSQIFLPGPTYDEIGNPSYKAFVGGAILNTEDFNGSSYLKQPEAVFIYNGQQIKIPVRYLYVDGRLQDFKKGLDSVFFIIPKLDNSNKGLSVDNFGAALYLSPKVSKSLFAQLYLMDDAFGEYPTIKLAHSEDDPVVASLKAQGLNLGEFVYYQGFRGPIKIWDTREIPGNILVRDEFLRKTGEYAELDELEFIIQ